MNNLVQSHELPDDAYGPIHDGRAEKYSRWDLPKGA
ncbi:hypothetical protein PSP31121_05390 [Pandoraea sputorum]|uniref:Uncharacterized protein n=1 Tax=Pandoraea sputorum TaxID=93222 RepID=A0A5E5BK52_9BURK|nr:hypothetical protein PSP31121_05390 [Pandoraea sputorum]